MSEPLCVCGHAKNLHDSPGEKINGGCAGAVGLCNDDYDVDTDCQCRMYRPVLPWPDSDGYWLVDFDGYQDVCRAIRLTDGTILVKIYGEWIGQRETGEASRVKRCLKINIDNPWSQP